MGVERGMDASLHITSLPSSGWSNRVEWTWGSSRALASWSQDRVSCKQIKVRLTVESYCTPVCRPGSLRNIIGSRTSPVPAPVSHLPSTSRRSSRSDFDRRLLVWTDDSKCSSEVLLCLCETSRLKFVRLGDSFRVQWKGAVNKHSTITVGKR